MSRRHHGRPHHGRYRHEGPRPDAGPARPAAPTPEATPRDGTRSTPVEPAGTIESIAPAEAQAGPSPMNGAHPSSDGPRSNRAPFPHGPNGAPVTYTNGNGHAQNGNGHAAPTGHTNGNGQVGQNGGNSAGCTAPQLRRFIKSRPYVPMHELRRRFAIDGDDDDVTPVDLEGSKVYVGLPPREGSLLGELLRGGEIGYELSFDPLAPIVVGVYPMRPVPRS